MNKKSISIVISAYKAKEFIEECLDSIKNQTYFKDFNDYEILLGFDGCEETKNKVLGIKNRYKNLKLFWFEENNGPYLVFNTLISKSKYDIICIFGADDIMKNDHIESNIKFMTTGVFIKTTCSNFNHPDKNKIQMTYSPDGLIFFNKNEFFSINGYDNWRCGADTDLNNRLKSNNIKLYINKKSTSLRRIHINSLTKIKKYGHNSEYRNKIKKIIYNRENPFLNELQIYKNVIEN